MSGIRREEDQLLIERLRRQKAIIAGFGELALSDMPLGELYKQAAERAVTGTGVSRSKVLRHDPGRGDFVIAAGVGWPAGIVGAARVPAGDRSPPGQAFRAGQAVVVEDLQHDPRYDVSEPLGSAGIVSLVNVPIGSGEPRLGVLEVNSDRAMSFGQDDIDFLLSLANLLAAAIERRRAQETAFAEAGSAARVAAERQLFLHELQHRVGNNFQGVLALLHRARREAKTEHSQNLIRQIAERLEAMIEANEQLFAGQLPATIRLNDYLARLSASLVRKVPQIKLESELDDAEVDTEQAVRIGLILNETVTNSIKHAFPGEASGTISVRLRIGPSAAEGVLSVTDDGSGLTRRASKGGSGIRLIGSLAEGMGASFRRILTPGKGTRCELRFPLGAGSTRPPGV